MVEAPPGSVEMRVEFCMACEELTVKSFTSVSLYVRSNLTETGTTSPVRQDHSLALMRSGSSVTR